MSTKMVRPTKIGSRSRKGNYLIAIDGKPVKAGDDYNAFLGRRLNRKVEPDLQ